jgi:hypothetical protein
LEEISGFPEGGARAVTVLVIAEAAEGIVVVGNAALKQS